MGMQSLLLPIVEEQKLLVWLSFNDYGQGFEDFGGLENIHIGGFDDTEPSELPDFDFGDFGADEFAGWIEEPLNIPCA